MKTLNENEIKLLAEISKGKSTEDKNPASDRLTEKFHLGYLIGGDHYRYTPNDQGNALELCKQYF